MKSPLRICPECGSETIVEKETVIGGNSIRIERCEGLIAAGDDKPLEACTWEEDLDDYYAINNISTISGVGIIKP